METKKTAKKTKSSSASKPTAVKRVRKAKAAKVVAHAVGRRKSSVARVWLRKGTGAFIVNGRDALSYFDTDIARQDATIPLHIIASSVEYDIDVNVYGGGVCSQAGAVKLGISRAFLASDESMRILLRQHNLLTVDSRVKERKKYGQKAARRRFQFVKR